MAVDKFEERSRRGADVFLEVLKSEGARHVFGNPGTTELPLIDALVDAPESTTSWRCKYDNGMAGSVLSRWFNKRVGDRRGKIGRAKLRSNSSSETTFVLYRSLKFIEI
jgi:hypothetical protein